MAKSSRLLSPEQVERLLKERRKRAGEPIRQVGASVSRVVERVEEQAKAIEALPIDALMSRVEDVLEAINDQPGESGAEAVQQVVGDLLQTINTMRAEVLRAIASIPQPEIPEMPAPPPSVRPESVNALREQIARISEQMSESPSVNVNFPWADVTITKRDKRGDIETVRVKPLVH